jgi:quinohemoprotein ethanol dehydrogenase
VHPKSGYGPILLPKPWRPRQPENLAERGAQVYGNRGCDFCHGVDASQAGRDIRDLRASTQETHAMMGLILKGAYRSAGMPAFEDLTDEDIVALQAFLTNRAWEGYERQEHP